MTDVLVTPAFVALQSDSGDSAKLGPDAWNASRKFNGGALGDLLYRDTGSATGASYLPDVAVGSVLVSGGVGAAPVWSASPTLTRVLGADGLSSAPTFGFTSQPASGMNLTAGDGGPTLVSQDVHVARFSGGPSVDMRSDCLIRWSATTNIFGTTDTVLARDAANVIAQRNGVNGQTHRWYHTYTDASNWERIAIEALNGNISRINYGQKSGTGTGRAFRIDNDGGEVIAFGTDSHVTLSYPFLHASYYEGAEIADPAAPAANKGRAYFRDNGSGKTEYVVRFPTGAVQVIKTEP